MLQGISQGLQKKLLRFKFFILKVDSTKRIRAIYPQIILIHNI